MPTSVSPMLATLGEIPRNEQGWAFEFKWDGIRAIAYIEGGRVRLQSRNLKDLTASFPELEAIPAELSAGPESKAVLDGEIVALDGEGRPSFQLLQQRSGFVEYVAFDLLYLNGRSLMAEPYEQRRRQLEELVAPASRLTVSPRFDGPGGDLLAVSKKRQLEGIVAKRLTSTYLEGRRSAEWVKIKNTRTQEVIIGGWTPGRGSRASRIGSLLLGVPEAGRLTYVGQVGTGFSAAALSDLARLLEPRERETSPFSEPVPSRYAKGARYVEPELVGEVAFAEWTSDSRLRHPSWRGIRSDKSPAEVRRES